MLKIHLDQEGLNGFVEVLRISERVDFEVCREKRGHWVVVETCKGIDSSYWPRFLCCARRGADMGCGSL